MQSPALRLLALASVLGASPVAAQVGLEVGGFGSFTKFDRSIARDDQLGAGARTAITFSRSVATVALEGEGVWTKFTGTGYELKHIPLRARLTYRVPVAAGAALIFGGGVVRNRYIAPGIDTTDWGSSGLLGYQVRLHPHLDMRVDAIADYMSKPANGTAALKENWNFAVRVGASIPLMRQGKKAAPAPALVVAAAPVDSGAPAPAPAPPLPSDADGDGVSDAKDECKATPAGSLVDPAGCQVWRDSDGDGVIDPRDKCAATIAGSTVDGGGCAVALDGDKDGVLDGMDTCPATPAGDKVDAFGCSVKVDTDRDGVDDSRDKCTATPAGTTVDAFGCPVLFKPDTKKVTLRGVQFEAGKAVLTPGSLEVLDDVARQLIDNPEIMILVAGHTDNIGTHLKNMRLSQARADAVMNYLVLQGVGADRLVAKGFGPDQPIASNKIRSGRIINRRVELRRSN